MKLWIFSLYLCLVLTQAAPLDKLRQQAARASRVAEASNTDASLSFLEKQQELAFEMEKESKHDITEADAVENLAKSEVEEAAAQGAQAGSQAAATESSQTSSQQTTTNTQAQQQTTQDHSTTTTTTTSQTQASDTQQQQQTAAAAATTTQSTPAAPEKTENKKPMEWEDAVLVEDLTKERASADANTKYIGANMKSSKVGTPKAPSFLQMGPPMYYYPVHPAFIQQAQRMRSQQKTTEGRSEEGTSTRAKGWGDYGTPLYWAEQFGSYDGLGAAGANMYGNYGYAPYASGYNPMYTQAAGGNSMIGSTPPYFEYGGFAGYAPYAAPSPPPVPADLPAPPYIQPAGTR